MRILRLIWGLIRSYNKHKSKIDKSPKVSNGISISTITILVLGISLYVFYVNNLSRQEKIDLTTQIRNESVTKNVIQTNKDLKKVIEDLNKSDKIDEDRRTTELIVTEMVTKNLHDIKETLTIDRKAVLYGDSDIPEEITVDNAVVTIDEETETINIVTKENTVDNIIVDSGTQLNDKLLSQKEYIDKLLMENNLLKKNIIMLTNNENKRIKSGVNRETKINKLSRVNISSIWSSYKLVTEINN